MAHSIEADAIVPKGWLGAYRFLLLRRCSQLALLGLFLLGPWFGLWLVKGNLAASLTLDLLPLTDPFLLLQILLAGHAVSLTALVGAGLVVALYVASGGRAYCAWVCPVNVITDTAAWLRCRLGITGGITIPRQTRYWLLAMVAIIALVTGTLAWEMFNPVTLIQRSLIFGMGLTWAIVLAVLLLDLFVSRRAWCGHLCPMGAFYSLIGSLSVARVAAHRRGDCDDCGDCFAVCPEPQVIKPALKGKAGETPVILAPNCTNCGRCIDVCDRNVFRFTHRFDHRVSAVDAPSMKHLSQQYPRQVEGKS